MGNNIDKIGLRLGLELGLPRWELGFATTILIIVVMSRLHT